MARPRFTPDPLSDFERELGQLKAQLSMAKMLCRFLWRLIRKDRQMAVLDKLDFEGQMIVDAAFEAAQAVHDRHHIYIEPMAPAYDERFFGRENAERYLAICPGGQRRVIDRATLLAMGGVHNPDLLEMRPTN